MLLPDLRAYARFLARNPSAADDLVQDALLRSLSRLDQFQPGTSLRAWTFTILRNTFYEQARRRRTERAVMDAAGKGDESMQPDQHGHIDVSDLARYLYLLPPLLREALMLVGAQGLSHDEAAAICAVPVGTMKARVSRARNHLSRAMAAKPGPSRDVGGT